MSREGYVLIEVAVAYVILTLALVCLTPTFIMSLKANKTSEKVQTATMLSQELMEEVRMRKWDENTPTNGAYTTSYSAIGREPGESATDKTTYDDVDDFNGWTESAIQDPMGNAVSGMASFTRTVTVQYVDSSFNVSAVSTDYKKISVCTLISGRDPICLYGLVTNH